MARTLLVLGGGPCGLAAAWEAARKGWRPVVLERENAVGGLSRTIERDGFRFDLGGHRFLSGNEALVREIEALLGPEALIRERTSTIHFRGRRFRYPLDLRDVLAGIEPWLGLRIVADYVRARRTRPRGPERSFADWVERRFGRTLYRLFFENYTEKLWGIPPSELSADWAGQRIGLPCLGQVLSRILGREDEGPRTFARRYLYPRTGIGRIYERMAQEVLALGGRILTGTAVVGLRAEGGRILAAVADGPDGRLEIEADRFLSTVPLPDLHAALGAAADPGADAAAGRLRFRAMRFLDVMLDGESASPSTWIYLPERRYLATRIQEPRHRSPDCAPPGRTSLMLEIPCTVGDAVWTAGDAEIFRRCRRDLAHVGIDVGRRTLGVFSVRAAHAYPIYHLGYRADRDRVLAGLARFDNIVSAGRQGYFRYLWMDQAILMGRAAFARLSGEPRGVAWASIGLDEGLTEARSVIG